MHTSVGDGRNTLAKFDTLGDLVGDSKEDDDALAKEFRKTYRTRTQLFLWTAAANLLAVNIIPVNDATARNHARLFEAIKNFVGLCLARPKYNAAADTRPAKTVLVDCLYYLMMAPRLGRQ